MKWISVDDKLPDNSRLVIVFDGLNFSTGRYVTYTDKAKRWEVHVTYFDLVKFWHEIPDLPKE